MIPRAMNSEPGFSTGWLRPASLSLFMKEEKAVESESYIDDEDVSMTTTGSDTGVCVCVCGGG